MATVRHVFTNPQADGADPTIVRPSDWNSAHAVTAVDGIAAGTQTASTGTIVFANSNGLTFGMSGSSQVTGSYTVPSTAGLISHINVSAGTTSNNLSAVIFSNSNGLSFGLNGSVVTGSHNGLTSQSNQNITAGNGGFAFQTLSFSNANGVSFSTSAGSAIVASHDGLTSQSNQAFSAQGGSSAFQTLNFRNANGLSFSNSGGSVEASYTVPTVPAQLSVGNSNLGNTAGDTGVFTGHVVFVGSDNITLSGSSNGGSQTISIFGPSPAGGGLTNIRVSAGTTSNLLSAITFADGNGVSFGLNASTVTASHNGLTSQSNQNVTAANGGFAFQTLSFSNVNGISFGTSAGSAITASHNALTSQTNQTLGIYVTAQSTGQSSSSTYDARSLSFIPDGIISAGWSNGSFRVSATQSNQAWSGSNASSTFQTLSFNNANGASWSNNAGAVQISYTVPTVTNSSWTVSDSATSGSVARLAFTNLNGFSFSLSTGAGGSHTLVGTYTHPVVSNAIQSVGSVTGSGTNTSRFAADDHVHAGVFSMGVSNDAGNTAGDTRVDVGRFVLRGGNNVTLSQITAANALNTVVVSAGAGGETRLTAYAVSNTTQSTSGTIPLSQLSFHGAGVVSVGISNGSILISAPGAAPSPVNFSAGTTSGNLGSVVFSNSNGVSFGLNGSTITASVAAGGGLTLSGFDPYGLAAEGVAGQQGQGTFHLQPLQAPNAFQFNSLILPIINTNSSNSSGSHTLSFWFGLYTRNASTLSLLASTSATTAVTHSGTAGSYSRFSGIRNFPIAWQSTFSASNYWVGIGSRTTSGGTNGTYSQLLASWPNSSIGLFGQGTSASVQRLLGLGYYSATTSAVPASIAFSQLTGVSSIAARAPMYYFVSGSF